MKTKVFFKVMLLTVCAMVSGSLASCENDDEPSRRLSFDPGKVEMLAGQDTIVKVSGGTAPYTVESNDMEVATAVADSDTIRITAVGAGAALIRVVDAKNISGLLTVTVEDPSVGLTFDKPAVALAVGGRDTVKVSGGVAPYTAVSADEGIATAVVNDTLIAVEGVATGTTTIAVTDQDGKSGTINVDIQ